MKNKINLVLVALLSLSASSLTAGIANIAFGSATVSGGGQFFGSDATAADSITIGFFAGNTVDATSLSGWTALASTSTFSFGGFANPSETVDTTAGDGLNAYLLIADGTLQAIVRLDSWATLTGADSPSPPTTLAYNFDSSASASVITSFAATGTTLSIFDGGGTNFSGGTSGTGVSFTLSAVPEPSTFAALAGLCALGAVMVRRRRA